MPAVRLRPLSSASLCAAQHRVACTHVCLGALQGRDADLDAGLLAAAGGGRLHGLCAPEAAPREELHWRAALDARRPHLRLCSAGRRPHAMALLTGSGCISSLHFAECSGVLQRGAGGPAHLETLRCAHVQSLLQPPLPPLAGPSGQHSSWQW